MHREWVRGGGQIVCNDTFQIDLGLFLSDPQKYDGVMSGFDAEVPAPVIPHHQFSAFQLQSHLHSPVTQFSSTLTITMPYCPVPSP